MDTHISLPLSNHFLSLFGRAESSRWWHEYINRMYIVRRGVPGDASRIPFDLYARSFHLHTHIYYAHAFPFSFPIPAGPASGWINKCWRETKKIDLTVSAWNFKNAGLTNNRQNFSLSRPRFPSSPLNDNNIVERQKNWFGSICVKLRVDQQNTELSIISPRRTKHFSRCLKPGINFVLVSFPHLWMILL